AVGAIDAGKATATSVAAAPAVAETAAVAANAANTSGGEPRRHTVARGDNAWTIARRYGIRVADLLQRNGLSANAVLKPGQALLIDAQAAP
ncbi:MAG: LysM peptidoglycan-binding domain-containing protein, partial [Lysobacter sp.]|nr:LysM peptidoglycan-binding domain-containing protein [Lysobacter sp.]